MKQWRKNHNSYISQRESEGRYKLLNTLNSLNHYALDYQLHSYSSTKSITARYDAMCKIGNQHIIIEVKCRQYASYQYDAQILEAGKYDALVRAAKMKGKHSIVWYVNYYTDGVCRIFNLNIVNKLGYGTTDRLMNYKTFRGVDKVNKSVYMLCNWHSSVEYNINSI